MDQLVIKMGNKLRWMTWLARSNSHAFKVGRGFANDLVITDPFADPQQVEFFRSEDGWIVRVVGTTNPTLLNGDAIADAGSRLNSGDKVTFGRTQLRVYTSDHEVESTRHMVKSSRLGIWFAHPLSASLMVIFVLAVETLIKYQERSTELGWWNELFEIALVHGAGILVWACFWALIGQLLRNQPNFTVHFGFTALVSGITSLVLPLEGYIEYATNSQLMGVISVWLIEFLSNLALLRANLMFATNLQHYTRMAVIASVALLLTLNVLSLFQS